MLKRRNDRQFFRAVFCAKRKKVTNFFAWRFFLLVICLLLLVFYGLPIGNWYMAIFADVGQTEVIRLYAGAYLEANGTEKAGGWSDTPLSLGAPQVSPEGSLYEFSAINSARYSGGSGYLTLGKFAWLNESDIEKTGAAQAETTDIVASSTGDGLSSSTEENPVIADSDLIISTSSNAYPELIATTSEIIASGTILVESENKNEPSVGVEIIEKEPALILEIIESEDEPATVEIIEAEADIEVEVEPPSEELSFFQTLKGILMKPIAHAQEYISETIEDLEDFGEYKGATLNFSLAGIDAAALKGEMEIAEADSGVYEDEIEDEDALAIWYSLGYGSTIDGTATTTAIDPRVWQLLDTISAKDFSNALNAGYLSYGAPWLENWQDIRELEVKIEGLLPDKTAFVVFLDSVFVEAEFIPGEELNRINVLEAWQDALELVSSQLDFTANESGKITFKYIKQEERLWDEFTALLGLTDFWAEVGIIAQLIGPDGEIAKDLPLAMIFSEDGEFTVQLPHGKNNLPPGKYRIRFTVIDASGPEAKELVFEQDFNWGVLALNANKSRYLPLEEVFLQMAVLDSRGHTLCGAELFMAITAPYGTKAELSTAAGTITANPLCGPNNVISEPDYYAYYQTGGEGFYRIDLMASTSAGQYEIRDSFEVKNELDFEVERIGPTRVYPMAEYEMEIIVKANKDFAGDIIEVVPEKFSILNFQFSNNFQLPISNIETIESGGLKKIKLTNVNLHKDEEVFFRYTFDPPNISPELFLLGPLELLDDSSFSEAGSGPAESFVEARQWQLASDLMAVSTSTSGTFNGWTDPSYAWTDSTGFYASRDIVRKTGTSPEIAYYLQATANTVEDRGGDINTVEIGVSGYVENTTVTVYLQPIYDGAGSAVNGTVVSISGSTLTTTDDFNPNFQLITDDPLRPNYPNPWTWEELQNMYIKVYGGNSSTNAERFLYIDQIFIQADYDPNNPPHSNYFNAAQKKDNSGAVDIYFQADDLDDDNLRAKLEYSADSTCEGSFSLMTIDTADANATSSQNPDIMIDNGAVYRIGTSTGYISTISGANNISADWLSKSDTSNADGVYCVRLALNDYEEDQSLSATTTVIIDNKPPTAPGNLSLASSTRDSLTVSFGASTTESHFAEYKIFYASTTPVGMKYMISSSTDEDLGYQDFRTAATTTISGLEEGRDYYVLIVVYDQYGYQASSSEVMMTTNKAPLGYYNPSSPPAQRLADASGVVDVSVAVGDGNNDELMAKVEYAKSADCASGEFFSSSLTAGISATYGIPVINNGNLYQISEITTPATNTLEFSWPTKTDLPYASSTYCLRFTLNDGKDDQNIAATATLMVDNYPPTATGQLQAADISTSSAYLVFGAPSIENNFDRYEVHYRPGTSGAVLSDPEYSDPALDDINYLFETQVYVSGLDPDTDYVFNIWAFDLYGNRSTSTEIMFKTDASVSNLSLNLLDSVAPNYIIAAGVPSREWTFRAVVKEEYGWTNLSEVVLRLADSDDSETPYLDLAFSWSQATDAFSEIGTDAHGAVALSPLASSTCAADTCTLDFTFVFAHDFSDPGVDYAAELYSVNDSAAYDLDNYPTIYQVRNISVQQTHYRWRYDDGGE